MDDSHLADVMRAYATRYHCRDDQQKDDGDSSHPLEKLAAIHDFAAFELLTSKGLSQSLANLFVKSPEPFLRLANCYCELHSDERR